MATEHLGLCNHFLTHFALCSGYLYMTSYQSKVSKRVKVKILR